MNTLLIHNDNLPQEVMDIFGDKKLKFDIHIIINEIKESENCF